MDSEVHIIEQERDKGNKTMYVENLNTALNAFDSVLDYLAEEASRKGGSNAVTVNPVSGQVQTMPVYRGGCNCGESKPGKIGRLDILDDIDQVIYNDPATIVTFKDGTKVCVKASKGDTFNKETGLVYAVVKRLYANDVDDGGYLRSRGLGEKINKIVSGSFDQKEQEKERRAKRKAKQAKKEAKAKKADEAGEKTAKEAVDKVYKGKKKTAGNN